MDVPQAYDNLAEKGKAIGANPRAYIKKGRI